MKEKKTARDLWVEDEVEYFISKMKPFYTKDGLKTLKYQIDDILGLGSYRTGVVIYYFGKYSATTFSKSLYNRSPEEEPSAIRKFLSNFYKLVKAVSKQDYETAKKAYDEEFAFFAQENTNNLQGPDFLCHHVIPGCKAKGFSEIFPVNVKETKLQEEARKKVEKAEKINAIKVQKELQQEAENKKNEEQLERENG